MNVKEFKLLENQKEIYDEIEKSYNSMFPAVSTFYVDAVAGSGKTTMIEYIVKSLNIEDFVYSAYNTAIVDSARNRLGSSKCKTYHAFARQYIDNPNIGYLRASSVKLKISYKMKELIVNTIDNYFVSHYKELYEYLDGEDINLPSDYVDEIYRLLEDMSERKIPITFNYMLKELHYQLLDGYVISVDAMFIDESQDMTPVMIEIFKLVDTKITVFLGDAQQSIYSFLNLKSVFDSAEESYSMYNSFRLSPELGEYTTKFCNKYIDSTFKIVGLNTSTERDGSKMYLTHTNTALLVAIEHYQNKGIPYKLSRDIDDIVKLPLKVEELLTTGHTKYPPLFDLARIVKKVGLSNVIRDYSHVLSSDVISAFKVVTTLKCSVSDIVDDHENTEDGILISTIHSVKGLEADTVTLSIDIVNSAKEVMSDVDNGKKIDNDMLTYLRLYYVAITRARYKVIGVIKLKE